MYTISRFLRDYIKVPRTITVQIKVYSVDEACERLAQLTRHKRPHYSHGGFYKIVRQYKPELTEATFSEVDLEFLANRMKKPGRPSKTIDKSE